MSWVITGTQKINWDPSLIATALWLDAADSSTVTTVSGNVSQWNDKSGNGRHASQSTAGSRPVYQSSAQNGLNAVRFTGASSHFLTAGSTSTWNFLHDGTASSVFIVTRVRNTGDNPDEIASFLGTASASAQTGYYIVYEDRSIVPANNRISINVFRGAGGSWSVIDDSDDKIAPGSYTIVSNYIDADNATPANRSLNRINGGAAFGSNALSAAPSTGNSSAALGIGRAGGSSFYLTGDICEVLLLNNQPETLVRQKIEGYLAHKWGITASLPSDHPYKTAVPVP